MLVVVGCRGQDFLLAMPANADQEEALIRRRQRLITGLPG